MMNPFEFRPLETETEHRHRRQALQQRANERLARLARQARASKPSFARWVEMVVCRLRRVNAIVRIGRATCREGFDNEKFGATRVTGHVGTMAESADAPLII